MTGSRLRYRDGRRGNQERCAPACRRSAAELLCDFAAPDFTARPPHGIGTARAFQVNELAGTFAGIGMGLNGALTALLVSVLALLR